MTPERPTPNSGYDPQQGYRTPSPSQQDAWPGNPLPGPPHYDAYYAMPYAPPPLRTSGLAIASLVTCVLILCAGGLGAIFPVIFGHLALAEIKRSHGGVQGRGMALAGLIVGYTVIGLSAISLIVLFVMGLNAPSSANPIY